MDICWLDCSNTDGHLKRHRDKEGDTWVIVLCRLHATFLEAGVFLDDYRGAPLPRDTIASRWPWRLQGEVDLLEQAK